MNLLESEHQKKVREFIDKYKPLLLLRVNEEPERYFGERVYHWDGSLAVKVDVVSDGPVKQEGNHAVIDEYKYVIRMIYRKKHPNSDPMYILEIVAFSEEALYDILKELNIRIVY